VQGKPVNSLLCYNNTSRRRWTVLTDQLQALPEVDATDVSSALQWMADPE
jgi:hypothetical protein